MINTVLCIGSSTFSSEETPENIDEALAKSRFLEKGSVILAFHLYFVLYSEPRRNPTIPSDHVFDEKDLADLKDHIVESEFPKCKDKIVFIDREGQHQVKQGFIYILPDSHLLKIVNSILPPLEAFLDEVDGHLIIQCFDRNKIDSYPEYSKYANHSLKYRPSINFTMEKLANSKIPNKLGLILAGKEDDGAKGLTSVNSKYWNIAIENPGTYPQYRGNYDMPYAAISEAEKNKIKYELISLYGENDSKSLTTWLCEQLS